MTREDILKHFIDFRYLLKTEKGFQPQDTHKQSHPETLITTEQISDADPSLLAVLEHIFNSQDAQGGRIESYLLHCLDQYWRDRPTVRLGELNDQVGVMVIKGITGIEDSGNPKYVNVDLVGYSAKQTHCGVDYATDKLRGKYMLKRDVLDTAFPGWAERIVTGEALGLNPQMFCEFIFQKPQPIPTVSIEGIEFD